jgi:hypothetical protein
MAVGSGGCRAALARPLGIIFVESTRFPTLSACPLRSDRVRTFAPQRIDAMCQKRTKEDY